MKKYRNQAGGADGDGLPHLVALAPGADLPAGPVECVCCEKPQVHLMIAGWDCDLEGYVCAGCLMPLADAEFALVHLGGGGIRRPDVAELGGLDEGAGYR